jgi:hypothetical protein
MFFRCFILAMAVVPLAACGGGGGNGNQAAQTEAGPGGVAGAASFSPEMRAKMQQIRGQARDASLASLSPGSRKAVTAAVGQFNAGSSTLPETANKIDVILTPAETSAILAQQRKMRTEMRQAFEASGATPYPGRRFGGGQGGRTPDAGRFLVQVLASPEKLREAMRRFAPPTTAPQ